MTRRLLRFSGIDGEMQGASGIVTIPEAADELRLRTMVQLREGALLNLQLAPDRVLRVLASTVWPHERGGFDVALQLLDASDAGWLPSVFPTRANDLRRRSNQRVRVDDLLSSLRIGNRRYALAVVQEIADDALRLRTNRAPRPGTQMRIAIEIGSFVCNCVGEVKWSMPIRTDRLFDVGVTLASPDNAGSMLMDTAFEADCILEDTTPCRTFEPLKRLLGRVSRLA